MKSQKADLDLGASYSSSQEDGKSVATMDIVQLRSHIDSLGRLLDKKVSERRVYFQDQITQAWGICLQEDFGSREVGVPEKWQDRQARKSEAKVSEQENEKPEMVRPRDDPDRSESGGPRPHVG